MFPREIPTRFLSRQFLPPLVYSILPECKYLFCIFTIIWKIENIFHFFLIVPFHTPRSISHTNFVVFVIDAAFNQNYSIHIRTNSGKTYDTINSWILCRINCEYNQFFSIVNMYTVIRAVVSMFSNPVPGGCISIIKIYWCHNVWDENNFTSPKHDTASI